MVWTLVDLVLCEKVLRHNSIKTTDSIIALVPGRRKQAGKAFGMVFIGLSGIYYYSHSIVAGGLELMSYTTLFTPFTLLMISLDTFARNSYGR